MRAPLGSSLWILERAAADGVRRRVLGTIWRAALKGEGVDVADGVEVFGRAIVAKAPGSTIAVGAATVLVSSSHATALGVSRPVILRTLERGAAIRIGAHCGLSGTTICSVTNVTLGDRVLIGADVLIADTDFHAVDAVPRRYESIPIGQPADAILVEDDVFVGARSLILKGVHIGKGSVIGAGSVVTGDIPPGVVAAGTPCRPLRKLRL